MVSVQKLQELTDEDLLEALGKELWKQGDHAKADTPEESRRRGKDWLAANMAAIRDATCGNSIVEAIREKTDEVALATALADIFLKSLGSPVPAIVGVLIARIGLDKLCGSGGAT